MIKGIIFDFNRTIYDPEADRLVSGCKDLLENLKKSNYRMCLISKKTKINRREQIFRLELDKYFKKILVIDGQKNKKHFRRCLNSMQLSPSEIAVVGDRVEGEIFLGNNLGMLTIWYKTGKFANILPKTYLQTPDCTIKDIREVLNVLIKSKNGDN